MKLWEMLKGPRQALKKVKFIYEPYRKIKVDYVTKKRRKALHKDGVETINSVEKALSEYGVTYFADYGTLLGIIRDHDFMQWDSDLDYGMIIDDNFDWKEFEDHMGLHGFHKIREFRLIGNITEQTYKKDKALTVDFFARKREENELIGYAYYRKPEYRYLSDKDYHVRKRHFALINTTTSMSFLGTYVTVPENADQYLESMYTKNWRIPDSNWNIYNSGLKLEELHTLGKADVLE